MTDSAQYLSSINFILPTCKLCGSRLICRFILRTCKLCGSRLPQSPTVNCLSEESDIASYLDDISLMFASLIQLNIINLCVLMANLN